MGIVLVSAVHLQNGTWLHADVRTMSPYLAKSSDLFSEKSLLLLHFLPRFDLIQHPL